MRLRTLIVDDEAPARKKIRHFLESDSEIEIVGECENGADALARARSHKPHLIFLDIQMPLLDGFAMLKRFTGAERSCAIIFVTAYDEYAIKAFDANAVDYLLKPFTRKRFEAAVQKVKEQVRRKHNSEPAEQALAILQHLQKENAYLRRIAVKSDETIVFLSCDRIDWIESDDNYVLLHSGKKTHLVRESIGALEKNLDPNCFIRIHRRILVNTDRIREMHTQRHTRLLLQDGSILPVSRRLKERVKRFLLRRES